MKCATHGGLIKSMRIPMSDVEAAKTVEPPKGAVSESSRRFAVMGSAILEKLCRSGRLAVRARRRAPYIIDTARGPTAVSVMVSAVLGDLTTKHMVVPVTSLQTPPGATGHVIVCAFVSKREKVREENGGLNVKLAGWATADEVGRYVRAATRVATRLEVAAVPVSDLRPIQTLRHYLSPEKGEQQCENHASDVSSSTSDLQQCSRRNAGTDTQSTTSS